MTLGIVFITPYVPSHRIPVGSRAEPQGSCNSGVRQKPADVKNAECLKSGDLQRPGNWHGY